jgi:Putative Actinobacterial Holin-X, holin superfamily III
MAYESPSPKSGQSVADILSSLGEDTTKLVRQEIELAKAEAREELQLVRMGAIELVGALFAAHVALIILSFALAEWLNNAMDPGWAYLIVGVVWLVAAAGLGYAGFQALKRVEPVPPRTTETIKQLPDTIRGE